jgi:predicted AAA+ superfamily ATPase
VVRRDKWLERLESALQRAPICWLAGVRRVGKTTLCYSLEGARIFNCDLPEVARQIEEPERFLGSLGPGVVVFDEIHQLADPARLLKIAADQHPELEVVATGSSTLAATEKFSDSLTGRKRQVHLVPVLAEELSAFGIPSLDRRLLRGGLPSHLLATTHDRELYAEWLDSYFARDVRELFHVQKRGGFLALLEAVLRQSGGQLEVASMSRASGLSRPTVMTYLDVMETTHVLTRLRPYSGGVNDRELVQAPKAYAFDTGFVAHIRGIRELRQEDKGPLLEHLVLESLQALPDLPRIHYWRDKSRREVDFVVPFDRERVDAIEVKWNADAFEPRGLRAFRDSYPKGRNWLVTAQTAAPWTRRLAGFEVTCVSIEDFRRAFGDDSLTVLSADARDDR